MRFGRRNRPTADDEVAPETGQDAAAVEQGGGPYDAADVDLDAPGPQRVDLGGLVVAGGEGLELRLQADEATGEVTAALLAATDGAVELRAFAAPKSGGLWDELRHEIAAEATRLGGTVDVLPADSLPQLRLQVPVKAADGRSAMQVSRVVAFEGPRWLLRATFVGAAAKAADGDAPLERAVREVVVVRGSAPMSPREPLPLRLPPDARPEPAPARTIDP